MRKRELAKKILLAAAAAGAMGGLTIALAVAPGLGMAVKPLARWYQTRDKYGRYRIRKTFAQLRRERLIDISETPEGKTRVTLTDAGKKKVLEYQFEDMKIEPMKKWDKKWRMVIFDVPQRGYKKARDALRKKLESLGFYQLQKSVWIHPYECRNEIDFIIEFFNISPYVRIAEVSRFDGDHLVKEKFEV